MTLAAAHVRMDNISPPS